MYYIYSSRIIVITYLECYYKYGGVIFYYAIIANVVLQA